MTTDTKPIHPGDVLLEVYMKPATPQVTVDILSQTLGVPEQVLTSLINGSESITPSLALQLSVVCRTTPEYWLQLQRTYNMQKAKTKSARRRRVNGMRSSHRVAA